MFWQDKSSARSNVSPLSRRKIIDALEKVLENKNDIRQPLSHEVVQLIENKFHDILNRNVEDTPEYLEKLLKAIINTIFLENQYPHPDASKLVYDNENRAFSQAINVFNSAAVHSIEKFEEAILVTVPPDGRVFLLNDGHLKPLQDLAKQCGITLNRAVKVEKFDISPASITPTRANTY